MGIAVYLNQTEKITVTFYGFPDDDGESVAEDPTDLEIRIYDTSTTLDTLLTTDSAIALGPTGKFYYEWTPTAVGDYNVQFFATFSDDSTNPVNNFFTVYEATTSPSGSGGLVTDQVLLFAGVLDPLYLDPEEFMINFPDVGFLLIAEIVNKYSIEVQGILALKDDEDPTFLALEYIHAATLCTLSNQYAGFDMESNTSFKLGDLEVSGAGGGTKIVNRGNAANWCELAAALRSEVLAEGTNFTRLSRGRGAGDDASIRRSRRLKRYPDSPIAMSTIWDFYSVDLNPITRF